MKNDVKVFSTSTCPYCVMVKDYLKKNNIEFENIDLTKRQKWINKMIARSGQMGVPQLWIGEKVIVGFNVSEINGALGI